MVNTTAAFLSFFATTTAVVDTVSNTLFGNASDVVTVSPPHAISPAPFGYKAGSAESVSNMKDKIKHVVWLLLENRSFDNILGGVHRPGLDNPANMGDTCNPVDVSDPTGQKLCTRPRDFDSIIHDPGHSIASNCFQFYGQSSPDNAAIQSGELVATNQGFIEKQIQAHVNKTGITAERAAAEVMGYYSEEEVPTMAKLVDEFLTFNYWFSCIPGVPHKPQSRLRGFRNIRRPRQKRQGLQYIRVAFHEHLRGSERARHIVAQLRRLEQRVWGYQLGNLSPDALFYSWTEKHAKKNVVPIENFFQDAYLGLLPQLSYLNPSCCHENTNSMHPNGNVSYGQLFVKQIYDAIRQGPLWDQTLFVLTYDESGGFYDHVPSPLAVRTGINDTYTDHTHHYTFHFDRYGGRTPTWLVSPYVPKAHIENYGTNPVTGNAEPYSATSVLKTLGLLWDIDDFTERVENSPSFDHLIGPKMRTDAPEIFPVPKPFPNDV
ncbi:phosphoesterase family-domain-containing protein [Roridomyces roridus]|uniref:Phosphoesterase family-domain-containing protein n=1 Tax=Roridomyces roridus TaxID=1738132 RepID=A0AAD7BE33_9AGAR|nr:phosphoesterase family-domain-containing protein [Roridomyces roridus]